MIKGVYDESGCTQARRQYEFSSVQKWNHTCAQRSGRIEFGTVSVPVKKLRPPQKYNTKFDEERKPCVGKFLSYFSVLVVIRYEFVGSRTNVIVAYLFRCLMKVNFTYITQYQVNWHALNTGRSNESICLLFQAQHLHNDISFVWSK